jgi:Zn-dependent protease with chaperone function
MSEQLDRIEESSVAEPVIQNIIDAHLECINSPLKLVSGRKFNAEPNDPAVFSRGVYIAYVPLGVIYVSDQLYNRLDSEELQYIVLHEIYHILNNDSSVNFLSEFEKPGFNSLLSKWAEIQLVEAEALLEDMRAVIKECGYPEAEETVRRNQELNADKYAVTWMGNKEPAISALKKLAQGKVESLPHVTKYGDFEFPELVIKERIEAIKQLSTT